MRLAIVGPKMQTIPIIDRRLSVVLSGRALEAVAPHFDRFIAEASRSEFPGACTACLSHAAEQLEKLFDSAVVHSVGKYVHDEDARVRRNTCLGAG